MTINPDIRQFSGCLRSIGQIKDPQTSKPIGQELLKRIGALSKETNTPWTYVRSDRNEVEFCEDGSMVLHLNYIRATVIKQGPKGNVVRQETCFILTIIHELFHILLALENRKKNLPRTNPAPTSDPRWTDVEEEEIIKKTNPFEIALGELPRIFHVKPKYATAKDLLEHGSSSRKELTSQIGMLMSLGLCEELDTLAQQVSQVDMRLAYLSARRSKYGLDPSAEQWLIDHGHTLVTPTQLPRGALPEPAFPTEATG